jgi:hypothetical protein
MAIGGALRAALRAGDFVKTAAESRRRARALADLNVRGGIGNPGRARGADEFLRRQGVDVDGMIAPGTGDPYMDWVSGGRTNVMPAYTESPFGGLVFESRSSNPFAPGSRGRTRVSGDAIDYNLQRGVDGGLGNRAYMYSGGPIEAPYEGFRVWPGMGTDGFPRTFDAPPPWMGRGTSPPVNRTTMYDSFYGDEFPRAFPRSPYDEPFSMFEPRFPTNNRFTEPNVRLGDPYLPYSSFFYGTGY